MKVKKNDIINLMVICLPLCPYKIFSIGDKDISAIYLVWSILILIGLVDISSLKRSFVKNKMVLVLIAYFVFNSYVLDNTNIGSIAQFILFWTIFLLSYRRVTYQEFQKTIDIFHKVMNFMAVYGIYAFIGRIFHFPLADLWIPGHMVEGYNWYNTISIGGITVARSNSIFLEPSTFSQYLAINILLYLFGDDNRNKKRTKEIVLNVIALMCSFSGTGLLLLFGGFLCVVFSRGGIDVVKKVIKKYRIWVGPILVCFIGILLSPVGTYMLSRLSEFDPTNTKSVSGYIRFVGQFNIVFAVMKNHPILGIGIGNVQHFIKVYRMSGSAAAFSSYACSMMVARYIAELGIIGLGILLLIYKTFITKKRFHNVNYKMLFICTVLLIPLCDSDISVNYWFFMYLLNIDFREESYSKTEKVRVKERDLSQICELDTKKFVY